MMNSQKPSVGEPMNWQLQAWTQLQASTLMAFTLYGVRGATWGDTVTGGAPVWLGASIGPLQCATLSSRRARETVPAGPATSGRLGEFRGRSRVPAPPGGRSRRRPRAPGTRTLGRAPRRGRRSTPG